jgi:hypothetical protein
VAFSSGSPLQPFVDAVRVKLTADAALVALVNGIVGHVSEAARLAYPYVVLGQRNRNSDAGAMQTAGSNVSLQIDVWSNHKGPSQAHGILTRIAELLEREPLTVTGFALIEGSVTCEYEDVSDEPDDDAPDQRLYHGVQRWVAEIHEA